MANQSDIKLNIVVSVAGQQLLGSLAAQMQKAQSSQVSVGSAVAKTNSVLAAQQAQVSGLVNRYGQPLQSALSGATKAQSAASVASVAGAKALGTQATAAQQSALYSFRLRDAQQQMSQWLKKTSAASRAQSEELGTLAAKLTAAEVKYDALYRASYRLQIVGYQLIGSGKAVLDMIKNLTDGWGQFEFTVNRAAGALQVWKNSAGGISPIYNSLIDKIEQTTKDLRLFPANDVAKATYFWASTSGQAVKTMGDLESVMKSVNPLMKIAALTETSYESAIKGVYSIIVQYGKSLNDVGDVTNKLFLVTQRTALEFPDLIQSFKMVGPIAATLGVSFEDVAGVLGQLGDAGLRGSLSGRALRQVFIQLARPTAKAQAALDQLFQSTVGINKSFQQVVFPNGKFIGLTGFVNALAFALKDATDADRTHLLASIATANELPVLTTLVGNQIKVLRGLPGAYDTAKSSVNDAANAATQFNRSWELLANSWLGITGRIKAGAEVIRLKVGRDIAMALTPAVEAVTKLTDKIEAWVTMNPKIVEALSKVAGFAATFSIIAGVVAVAIGAVLGLYSAIGFLATGFGKLVAPVTVVAGLFTLIGEGILRNWTRITRILTPALDGLRKSLGLTSDGLKKAQDVWAGIHKTVNDFIDFIIRVAVSVFRTLIDIITTLVRSPLAQLAPILLQLIVIFKTLSVAWGVITGIITAFKVVLLTVQIGLFAAKLEFTGLGLAARAAGGGIGALVGSLKALSLTSVLAIFTGLVFAFQQLASMNFLGLGTFIDHLTHGIPELRNEIKDLLAEMGSAAQVVGPAVAKAISAPFSAAVESAQAQVDKLDALAKSHAGDGSIGRILQAEAIAKKKLDEITRDELDKQKNFIQDLKDTAEIAGVSFSAFSDQYAKALTDFGLDTNKAKTYALDFFATVKNGSPTVTDAINLWNKLVRDHAAPSVSPEDFLRRTVSQADMNRYFADFDAKSKIAMARADIGGQKYNLAYEILNNLKLNSNQYSDEINNTINTLLGDIPETVKGIITEASDVASQGPKAIADAVIAGVSAIKSFKTDLKKALSQLSSPQDFVTGLLGNLTSADLQKAFSSSKLGSTDLAQSFVDSMTTSFADAYSAALDDPASLQKLKDAIGGTKKHKGLFTPEQLRDAALGKLTTFKGVKLTPEQTAAVQQIIDTLYPQLFVPPSQAVVAAANSTIQKQMPKLWAAEFGAANNRDTIGTSATAGADAIATAVAAMQKTWTTPGGGEDFVQGVSKVVVGAFNIDLTTGGYNTLVSWYKGLKKAAAAYGIPSLTSVLGTVAQWTKGKSPPPKGPLHDIDQGGYNIGKAWAEGLGQGSMLAVKNAHNAANGVRNALRSEVGGIDNNLSIDTNAQRHIAVDVNVTSPDGSVSKVDMKTLAGALTGTALVRSIEQAAAAR